MYERILVVVGDRAGSPPVTEGVALAKVHGAEVVFVHVVPQCGAPADRPHAAPPADAALQHAPHSAGQRVLAAARVAADKAGVTSQATMPTASDAVDCVADAARDRRCGLVVVASEDLEVPAHWQRSAAIPGLIDRAGVPVLVCRSAQPGGASGRQPAARPRDRA
jgi:nucleotide-binding universal stress UspA family protein